MIIELSKENSILSQFISELRNVNVQKDSMRFRRNLERIGEIFAYEISKKLEWKTKEITTPLGVSKMVELAQQPVLTTILRAGLPLHQGLLNYFDKAENGFISAYRKHLTEHTFEIVLQYSACPDVNGKVLILSDPMLASGHSMIASYESILKLGKPKHIHIAAVIGSRAGVDYVRKNLPDNVTIWLGAIDPDLNDHSYIVPGLGDAGDLAFGVKL
ncbi:MAG TPA: uracil phosphoribosyltransferase [Bacteroidia bacterium]|jgi:uracil phosphoribosyltransferase|nr:uracil phosphoribosyltransferase [Bacteroidia bacterium]